VRRLGILGSRGRVSSVVGSADVGSRLGAVLEPGRLGVAIGTNADARVLGSPETECGGAAVSLI
jgi:hypothetical protein